MTTFIFTNAINKDFSITIWCDKFIVDSNTYSKYPYISEKHVSEGKV